MTSTQSAWTATRAYLQRLVATLTETRGVVISTQTHTAGPSTTATRAVTTLRRRTTTTSAYAPSLARTLCMSSIRLGTLTRLRSSSTRLISCDHSFPPPHFSRCTCTLTVLTFPRPMISREIHFHLSISTSNDHFVRSCTGGNVRPGNGPMAAEEYRKREPSGEEGCVETGATPVVRVQGRRMPMKRPSARKRLIWE